MDDLLFCITLGMLSCVCQYPFEITINLGSNVLARITELLSPNLFRKHDSGAP